MDGVILDILDVLQSRGALTKDDIIFSWGLSHEDYETLKPQLLAQPNVESGPQKTGGIRFRPPRGPLPTDAPSEPRPNREAWENAAIDRLAELLQHKELEDLLGDLVTTVRAARKLRTGEDRRGNKTELAEALLLKNSGIDLFSDPDVRRAVARRSGIAYPHRWHAGKATAMRFAREAGFPNELAGIPSEDTPQDFEYLEGRIELKELQDFQYEIKRKVLGTLFTPDGRCIVTLPTGAGKTRVAVESIHEWLVYRHDDQQSHPNTVLWLAHSGELCEQAYAEFSQVWRNSTGVCPLLLCRFWGQFTPDLGPLLSSMAEQPTVLISTPQRIVNLFEPRTGAEKAALDTVLHTTGLIVVDEAHRAAAPTYIEILETFRANVSHALLGLTATPFRQEYLPDSDAGTRDLATIFLELHEATHTLGENPRDTLQRRSILAQPRFELIKTATLLESPPLDDPEHITSEDIERIDRALGIRADRPQRRMAVFKHILDICKDSANSILYFGPSILDAECMAFLLRQEGVTAAVVSGDTRNVTRRRVVSGFKEGQVRVLCNCEVLTTGFDAPRVTHVVVARPTVSSVLYEQMVGRGLRGPVFGGTAECVIIDCEDNYKSERPVLGYKKFRHMWGSNGEEMRKAA